MNRKIEIDPSRLANLTRRALLGSSMGLGAIAAAKLLGAGASLAGSAAPAGEPGPESAPDLGKLTTGHFPARAKRVIDIHMKGAVSQVDTFDYKPEVIKRHGEEIPPSVKGTGKISSMSNGQTSFPLMRPIAPFRQYGRSGRWVSDLMPHIGAIADDLTFIHTIWTPQVNHDPADIFMHTGFQLAGRPSAGGVGQLRARHRQREPAVLCGDEVAVSGRRRRGHASRLVGGLPAIQPSGRGVPFGQ